MTTASTDALVTELDSASDLPAGFGPLLHAVSREWFIPDRIWVDRKPVDRLAQPGTWLHAVYSDTVVVTQFDDGRTQWPQTGEIPTCSASMPSAVVGMLAQLDAQHGHSVLEIGTGTGFNAALLSELVGPSGNVTTVEIDPVLADSARDCLSRAGFGRAGRGGRPMTGVALVLSVVDSRSRVLHLVAMETAALHRRSGRYPALCDTEVISASMMTEPDQECQNCQSQARGGAGTDRSRGPSGRGGFRRWWPRRSRRTRPGTPGRHRGPNKPDEGLGR